MSLTALAFVATYAYGLLRAFTSHPGWGLVTYMAVFYLHPPMRWWGASLPDAIRLLERRHILRALEDAEWVQTAAARALGIHESTLRKKMKQLSIEREQKTA